MVPNPTHWPDSRPHMTSRNHASPAGYRRRSAGSAERLRFTLWSREQFAATAILSPDLANVAAMPLRCCWMSQWWLHCPRRHKLAQTRDDSATSWRGRLGHSIIVENDEGAGGTAARRRALQASADGYRILLDCELRHDWNPFQSSRPSCDSNLTICSFTSDDALRRLAIS
jgi:hypothetical protein